MAQLDPKRHTIVAETQAERTLLEDCLRRGAEVVLLEALYPVQGGEVQLPANLSEGAAWRVCRALEQAAEAHVTAQERRRSFRLVKS